MAAFLGHVAIDALVVALPQGLVDDPPPYLRPAALHGAGKPVRLVAGGDRRQDSVANAFGAADAASDIIVIHDAARPFASADLIARTIAAAAESGAALAAVASRDTVKRVLRHAQDERERARPATLTLSPSPFGLAQGDPEALAGSKGERLDWVSETLPRETIYLAQTPQAFRRDVLAQAIAAAARTPLDATDEATLVERAGRPVRLVEGEATNIKITTPADLILAEAIAANPQSAIRNPQSAIARVGTGYDLHRLVEGRPLVLGGVTIPCDRGALGHSDADVVCHAVTDALLGAACLGDIGRHFPDTDPRWKDASSLDLLSQAVALVAEQGLEVGNVDVTVILEKPKIKDHVEKMRAAVAAAVGVDVAAVSVKGKTNEGVDAIGRGEAIAAHAIVLIRAIQK